MLILIDLSVGIRPALLHHLCIRCAAVTLGPRMLHICSNNGPACLPQVDFLSVLLTWRALWAASTDFCRTCARARWSRITPYGIRNDTAQARPPCAPYATRTPALATLAPCLCGGSPRRKSRSARCARIPLLTSSARHVWQAARLVASRARTAAARRSTRCVPRACRAARATFVRVQARPRMQCAAIRTRARTATRRPRKSPGQIRPRTLLPRICLGRRARHSTHFTFHRSPACLSPPAVNCSFEPSTARCWRWAVRARGCLIVLELARAHLTLDATLSAHVHPGRAKRQPHRSCNPCNDAVRMTQVCSEPVRTLSFNVRKRSGGSWTLPDTPIQPRAESSFCEAPLAGSSREGARGSTSRLVPLWSVHRSVRRLRSKKWSNNTFKRPYA